MAVIVSTDPATPIDFEDGRLFAEMWDAAVANSSAGAVDLVDAATGASVGLQGWFTAFDAAGHPTAGQLVEIHWPDLTLGALYQDAALLWRGQDPAALISTLLSGGDYFKTASRAANLINGHAGDDTIDASGSSGANSLYGGDGADLIQGGADHNLINGDRGEDTIIGRSQIGDWLCGGQGDDRIDASASTGGDILNGNLGDDTLVGGGGADTLHGGQGDDVIHAGSGADWICGDLGTNTVYGGQGMDTFHAAAGRDVISGWHSGDVVQLATGVTCSVSQVGADVHITFSNGGEMDLLNTQTTSLTGGWLLHG
jgi:Ca2+-binding RTX toxin-like protein